MMIRRYVGGDERELIRRIRTDLGADAVILHTAYGKRSGIFGLFREKRIEIVAGRGVRIVKDFANGATGRPAPAPRAETIPASEALQKEFRDLKRLVTETQDMVRHRGAIEGPPELAAEFTELATRRVSDTLARKMIGRIREQMPADKLKDRPAIREAVRTSIREMIRCSDTGITLHPGRCTRIAFIGPTGVGKTTTIAKLVSIYAHQGRELGVITNDTYRIAATEQIKRVAQLVGVPLRVCRTPEEIRQALKQFADRDLVLVDTAGRSQKNAQRIEELKQVLDAVEPDETHLVVSMTTGPETVVDVAERFAPCGYDRLVVTKLDESIRVGVLLDVLSRVQTELSFIATGQEIPSDIEVADADRVASLILGEEAL